MTGFFSLERRNSKDVLDKLKQERKKSQPTVKSNAFLKALDELRSKDSILEEKGYDYGLITDVEELTKYADEIKSNGIAALDTETTGLDPISDKVVGFSVYTPTLPPAYIPVNHISYITQERIDGQLSEEEVARFFSSISEEKLIFHNTTFDTRFIRHTFGVDLEAYYDTYTAMRMLNENQKSNSLKDLYDEFCEGKGDPIYFKDLFKNIPVNLIPIENMRYYAAHDTFMTYKLYEFQHPFFNKKDLQQVGKVFWNIEMPVLNIVSKMEDVGFNIDYELNQKLLDVYTANIKRHEEEILESLYPFKEEIEKKKEEGKLDKEINFNSSEQLAVLMYDIMGYEHTLTKKKPRSTDKFVLESLGTPFTQALLEYKRYTTLVQNFIEKLPEMISADGKLHTSLNPTGTVTMRFSSKDPNLQQIPSHDKFIRKTLIPDENHIFISGDYSKQEMVVAAYVSKDEKMLEAFREGKDIYSAMASLAYGVPYEDCLDDTSDGKERRSNAKAVVLGIMFGKGVTSIGQDLGISRDTAQDIYDKVMDAFPELKNFMEDSINHAKQYGYVNTYVGSKRRLPDINLPRVSIRKKKGESDFETRQYWEKRYYRIQNAREPFSEKMIKMDKLIEEASDAGWIIKDNSGYIAKAERQCVNSIVQGTAAYMTKIALLLIDENERFREIGGRVILPIHDEILAQIPIEYAEEGAKILEDCMIASGKEMDMDISVDVEIESRWTGEMTDELWEELNG